MTWRIRDRGWGCHLVRDIDMLVDIRFCIASRTAIRVDNMGLVATGVEGSDCCSIIFLLRAAQVPCAVIRLIVGDSAPAPRKKLWIGVLMPCHHTTLWIIKLKSEPGTWYLCTCALHRGAHVNLRP